MITPEMEAAIRRLAERTARGWQQRRKSMHKSGRASKTNWLNMRRVRGGK